MDNDLHFELLEGGQPMMMTHTRWLWAVLIGAACLLALGSAPAEGQNCINTPEGPLCQVQQPLVSASLVDTATQKRLGLVTVGGGCSGTLVNRSWVLTADHCVTTNAQLWGPQTAMTNLVITAVWTTRTAIPSFVVRGWVFYPAVDLALLYLGGGDLGPANVQPFFVGPVDTTQTITKYGRGIFDFATQAPLAPAQSDGKYRSGQFTPSAAGETFISVQPNGAGQIANGGDSGGPDIVTAPDGTNLGIAGVQSTCVASGYVPLPFLPRNWNWATGISSCTSAGLAPIRFDLVNVISRRAPAVSNDFDDDHRPDIVWHNDSTGETQIWFMNGSSREGRANVVDESGYMSLIRAPWRIVGSRDFNQDDQTDLLWYNSSTGELQVWFMRGYRIAGRATVVSEYGSPMFVGPPWSVAGVNDMNGDGYADIVWHNDSRGETQLWLMNGISIARRTNVVAENGGPIFVGLPWSIVATDDMNGDGKPDIIWHNAASGETQIWYMNTDRITRRATVYLENNTGPALAGLPWHIVGTGDFDRDGLTDILWHNEATGETLIWFMNWETIKSRATVDALADGGGAFVGVPWSIMPH
ncbi:MAG: hypothetical protein DMG11_26740 [Acidobacteria bacterium]|nr:MAG: hypothetical protein DMG11_26740 [Acidobacteriota bacterium]